MYTRIPPDLTLRAALQGFEPRSLIFSGPPTGHQGYDFLKHQWVLL